VKPVVDERARQPLLELREVGKHFGGLRVIYELDLHVDEGEIVSVIGPNGAGKTTLFNLVTGVGAVSLFLNAACRGSRG